MNRLFRSPWLEVNIMVAVLIICYIAMGFTLIESINEIASDGTYVGGRKSCGPFQGAGLESNDQRDYGTCSSPGRFKALNILWDIPVSTGDRTHSYQGKELFFEFFRYLTGQGVYNAHNGYTDYATSRTDNLDDDYPAIAWDTSIESGPRNRPDYVSPIDPKGACSKIYTVNMMFQVSNQEDDSDDAIENLVDYGGFGNNGHDGFILPISHLNLIISYQATVLRGGRKSNDHSSCTGSCFDDQLQRPCPYTS